MDSMLSDSRDPALMQNIGRVGEKILRENMSEKENLLIRLQGAIGQALAVTDKNIYIIKYGMFAGTDFGGRCLSFHYKNITGVTITKKIFNGMFEIVTPGNQGTSFRPRYSARADNTVTFYISGFSTFQKAANLIRELINEANSK